MEQVSAALVAACAELGDVPKKHKANVGTYSYDYADLADTLSVVRPVLAKHGLAVLQPVTTEATDDLVVVSTVILHKSGERLELGRLGLPLGQGAQATGSAITYARRYALLAALGLAAEDDDGAAANAAPRRRETPRAASKPVERPSPRSGQEIEILDMLGLLSSEDKRRVVADFKTQFGCGLSALPVGSHQEALEWVMNMIDEINNSTETVE